MDLLVKIDEFKAEVEDSEEDDNNDVEQVDVFDGADALEESGALNEADSSDLMALGVLN